MTENIFSITPSTRVAELLDHYPDLEDVLIGIAPPFAKLKNPILRKSVARVATLKQAAAVARMPVDELVNALRTAVGQSVEDLTGGSEPELYFTPQPDWFDSSRIVESINEETDLEDDVMPLNVVLQRTKALEQGDVLELVTSFLPAPGIDIMKRKGFLVWSEQNAPDQIRTYFSKRVD